MALDTHLYRRGATYYWRRALPASACRLISKSGGVDLRISLRTQLLAVARQRARRVSAASDVVLSSLSEIMHAGQSAASTLSFVRGALAAVVDQCLEEAEFARATMGMRGPEQIAARVRHELQRAEGLERALAVNDLAEAGPLIEIAESLGHRSPDPGTGEWAYFARKLMGEMISVHRTNALREQGIYATPQLRDPDTAREPVREQTVPEKPVQSPTPVSSPSPGGPAAPGGRQSAMTVVEAVELWNAWAAGDPSSAADQDPDPLYRSPPVQSARKQAARSRSAEELRDRINAGRLFRDLIGNIPVRNLTREHAKQFRDRLAHVPKMIGKPGPFFGLSAPKAIEKANTIEAAQLAVVEDRIARGEIDPDNAAFERISAGVPRLSAKTINKHLDSIGRLVKWLVAENHLPTAISLQGLRFTRKDIGREARDERDAWSDLELRHLFTTPAWTGCAGTNHRHRRGRRVIRDSKFWLPLLAAHLGLRLEEMAQALIDDITLEPVDPVALADSGTDVTTKVWARLQSLSRSAETIDVWVFRVQPGDGKTVKNESSKRVVPIVPLLIELGLIDYVQSLRKAGKVYLFPELRENCRGKRGAKMTEWFTRYLRQVNLYHPQRGMHSMRHTFDTHLHERDVPVVRVGELLGHAQRNETSGRYFKGSSFVKLVEAICSVDYRLHVQWINGKAVLTNPEA